MAQLLLKSYGWKEKDRALTPECVPKNPRVGQIYEFAVKDECPQGESELCMLLICGEITSPLAKIKISDTQKVRKGGEVYTLGLMEIKKLYSK